MSGSVSGAFRKQMSRDLVHRVKAGSWKSVLYASFLKDLICLKDERTPGSCVLGKLMEAPALVRHRVLGAQLPRAHADRVLARMLDRTRDAVWTAALVIAHHTGPQGRRQQ